MNTIGKVPLIQTEASLRLLQQFLTECLRAMTNPTHQPRINHPSGFGPTDPRQIRAHADYLRIVSLVEAFTDTVHQSLVESAGGGVSPDVVNRAIGEHLVVSSLSWRNREEAFQRIHGIDLSKSPRWKDFHNGAIEVRNAIAHGLGELTRKQQRKGNIGARLRQIKVRLVDGQVRLDENSLRECAAIARGYIAWLDCQARSAASYEPNPPASRGRQW